MPIRTCGGRVAAETVLAIVAHPDDESFWMGGTLRRYVDEGKRVVVVVASDGMYGRGVERGSQLRDACRALGVDWERCSWFNDQQSDRVPQVEINNCAERYVRRYEPAVVLTHYHSDLNIDHRRVCEAVLVATRDVCPVLMCEPEYPDRCVGQPFARFFQDVYELTAEQIAAKWSACQCYPEELTAKPITRSKARLTRSLEYFVRVP
jgi:LmbE family N-acetylglucosaminyl deacetylase